MVLISSEVSPAFFRAFMTVFIFTAFSRCAAFTSACSVMTATEISTRSGVVVMVPVPWVWITLSSEVVAADTGRTIRLNTRISASSGVSM